MLNEPAIFRARTDRLRYQWELGAERSRTEGQRKSHRKRLNMIRRIEEALRTPEGRDQIRSSYGMATSLYDDVVANGMVNPLSVVAIAGGVYVRQGCQRLAVARALGWEWVRCVLIEDGGQLDACYVPYVWDGTEYVRQDLDGDCLGSR